jgi:hypothetical protein
MINSQALDTIIGLALLMFVFATAASGILDLCRRLINSRSKDLEVALRSLLKDSKPKWWQRFARGLTRMAAFVGGPTLDENEQSAWEAFTSTSVYRGAAAARNQVRPAYLSAKRSRRPLRNSPGATTTSPGHSASASRR